MKKFKWWDEDAPTNATGPAVVGTGDDSSTVVVKQKRPKIYKRKKRKIDMEAKRVDEARRTDAVRNYRKEYDNYHSQPEQRERNAARLRARRQMEKWGKVKKFDKKDVHHKDNNPLNNEKDNLAVTTQSWNRSEPRLRKEEVSANEYDSLKKGDTVTIDYKSAMSSGKSTFKVTAKNVVGKARVGKVTLQSIKNPKSVKSFLYKRGNKVSFAQGDMGASVVSFAKEESINIQERELTPKELKRREEIAQDLSDADFKKRYGDRWKEVKMGVATNMAKKESIDEADDPKADKAKAKELKIAKAIAQAQLAIAKEQERVQKLTDLQKKVKDQAAEETTMNNKYFDTKQGTLEEATLGIWTDAAEEVGKLNVKQEGFSSTLIKKAVALAHKMGGNMTGAVKKIEKMKRGLSDDPAVVDALRSANEQVEGNEKVDGRTKAYKETIRRIKMRQERNKAKTKTVTEETLEEANITVYLDAANPDWMKKAMKKYGVKGKIHKRDVNPGYDSWKVTGDPKKLYKLYSDDEYGGDESFDDFIDMHKESVDEASGDKEAYKKFFDAALKKFGVDSPAELDDEQKKKFFDYVDKNWEGDNEKKESIEDTVLKIIQKKNLGEAPAQKGTGKAIGRIEYVEYKFKSPRDAIAAKKYFEAQQRMEFEVYGSHRDGELTVDAGKNDMAEYHRVIMQKYKPKVVTSEQKKNLKKDDEDEDENPVGKSYNEAVVGKDALDAIYDIVNKKQHGKVLGVKVDLFTASAMQKVYQALNDKNKDKVEKMLKDKRGVMTFAQFAMSQVK